MDSTCQFSIFRNKVDGVELCLATLALCTDCYFASFFIKKKATDGILN